MGVDHTAVVLWGVRVNLQEEPDEEDAHLDVQSRIAGLEFGYRWVGSAYSGNGHMYVMPRGLSWYKDYSCAGPVDIREPTGEERLAILAWCAENEDVVESEPGWFVGLDVW